jgi:hypothetical protein
MRPMSKPLGHEGPIEEFQMMLSSSFFPYRLCQKRQLFNPLVVSLCLSISLSVSLFVCSSSCRYCLSSTMDDNITTVVLDMFTDYAWPTFDWIVLTLLLTELFWPTFDWIILTYFWQNYSDILLTELFP